MSKQSPSNSTDTAERIRAASRVSVLFPTPLHKAFDYLSLSGDLKPGTFVEAPFAGRRLVGVVWPNDQKMSNGASNEKEIPLDRLKELHQVFDKPTLAPSVIDFVEWTSTYTMAPLGSVLRLVIRNGDVVKPKTRTVAYRLSDFGDRQDKLSPWPITMTEARKSVLTVAAAHKKKSFSVKSLAAASGVSDAVVRGLIKAGFLEKVHIDADPPFDRPDPDHARPIFSEEQAKATSLLSEHVQQSVSFSRKPLTIGNAPRETSDSAKPILLDGITGSGKTEVYLEAVAAALASDDTAQTLILIPEIALTLPFLERIATRFGVAPAPWHSDLTPAQRRRTWRRTLDGNARIVVGARSALFLPYQNLRLIIVDEEHEAAYKQEDGVIYQGRDLAVARGVRSKFPVILVSATPSLETVVNVDKGRYDIVRLRQRYGAASLPNIELVDLRTDPPKPPRDDAGREDAGDEVSERSQKAQTWLSPTLVQAVDETLEKSEQALLFLNRRGYAPLTICRKCGERIKSPHSDSWLVEHRFENKLVCHHTGFSMPKPRACPSCKAVGTLHACGPGVERIAEEAKSRWPSARLGLLSSDTASSPQSMRSTLNAVVDGKIDILIATQVVAKGHHFPGLTLVGVVDADMGLSGGDLRAGERTFQLLSQVSGRAGRDVKSGRAILQTHQPDAAVLQALKAGDRDQFLVAEAAGRESLGFPPYGRLAAIILRSENEGLLKETARAHRDAQFKAEDLVVMGPAPAPIYRLRGEMRVRFLIKAKRHVNIQAFLASWLSRVKLPTGVRRSIDIDPYTFL
ncbi:MAG: primosomal protein N' [Pseudomonadota bacterium]